MHRVGHADFEVTNLLLAAFAHGASFLLETFAFDPKTCFENGHDFRAKLLSRRQKIAQVVRVRVREKNRVEAVKFFPGFRAAGVGRYPGVNQCDLPGRSGQRKSAVAEIGDAVAFEVEHKIPFERGYLKRLKRMRSSNKTFKRLRENIWHFHLQLRIERPTGTLSM